MSNILISANHISLSHHGKKVLDDVSFELFNHLKGYALQRPLIII
jgi:hypothetical protein